MSAQVSYSCPGLTGDPSLPGRSVNYGMTRPSEDIEYDDPSLKEEEPIHDDFNFGHRLTCDVNPSNWTVFG
jgi:hypothetical protein